MPTDDGPLVDIGYRRVVCAVLLQAIIDAQRPALRPLSDSNLKRRKQLKKREDAIKDWRASVAWLQGPEAQYWAELIGFKWPPDGLWQRIQEHAITQVRGGSREHTVSFDSLMLT